MPGDRGGEDPGARQSIEIMMGMLLAETSDDPSEERNRTIAERRDEAWAKLVHRLKKLQARGDISKQEHDDQLAFFTAERDKLRAVRLKEEATRKAAREAFRVALPPRPTVQAAFDIARGAALRADGEDRPVEALEQRKRAGR